MTQDFEPGEGVSTDERIEVEGERKRRSNPWPWVALVVLVLIALWLLWQFVGCSSSGSRVVVKEGIVQVTPAKTPALPPNSGQAGTSEVGPFVPDVMGLTESVAVNDIRSAGYVASVTEVFGTSAPENTVTSQNPFGGTRLVAGGTVGIVVQVRSQSTPTYPMPDLVGMSDSAAVRRLAALGITPTISYSPRKPAGRVLTQWPLPGKRVASGGDVQIQVTVNP